MKPFTDMPRRWALALMVALLLGAAFVRVYDLAATPPGEAFDTTWDLADALRISRGIPFPAVFDTRSEPLHRFMLGGMFVLIGPSIFTARLLSAFFGILTVALTYRAGLEVLHGKSWRRLGALLAAGALAAIVPHIFLSRVSYRVVLTPIAFLATLTLLLRASRTQSGRAWLVGGFFAGSGLHTYLAGIALLPFLGGALLHQAVIAPRSERIRPRNILLAIVGVLPPFLAWLWLVRAVPDLFFRVQEAGGNDSVPLVERLINGLWGAVQAFFMTGFALPMYNTPDTPFFNPILAALVIVGFVLALWRWRHANGAFLLGALLLFTVPAALSQNAMHPPRLVGTMPVLALLAGWGGAWVLSKFQTFMVGVLREAPLRRAIVLGAAAIIIFSLAFSHRAYQGMFHDPTRYAEPEHWLSIPHNYTIAYMEALDALTQVDVPTYVPLSTLDTPIASFMLQRAAFPNVTTWARSGLTELPDGQIFYPTRGYYHAPTPDEDALQVLLLPDTDTMVILPGPSISKPDSAEAIVGSYGWTVALVSSVENVPLPPEPPSSQVVTIGNGLQLLGGSAQSDIQPRETADVLLWWAVDAPQRADLFSFAQLVNTDVNAFANSDHHILPYLYPSARWQAGDIIPDLHRVLIPDDLHEGIYRWVSGAYVPPGQTRLPIIAPEGVNNPLGNTWLWGAARWPMPLTAALPEDVTPLDVQFDDGITLEGYTLAQAADAWTVTLYWRAASMSQGDYTLFVHAMDIDSTHEAVMVVQQDIQPSPPTWAWQVGELVATEHTLTIPIDGPLPDVIYVGMYSFPSLARLSVQDTGEASVTDDGRVVLWTSTIIDE